MIAKETVALGTFGAQERRSCASTSIDRAFSALLRARACEKNINKEKQQHVITTKGAKATSFCKIPSGVKKTGLEASVNFTL